MKRKRVHFEKIEDSKENLSPDDNGLRSPGHDNHYSFFNPISPNKSILKNKINEQKELVDIISFQEQQQKLLFKTVYEGLKSILDSIKEHILEEKIRKTVEGFFFASLADFQLNLLTTISQTYSISGIRSAKKALTLDLYYGAHKLSKHDKSIKLKVDDVFDKFKNIDKTRFLFSGRQKYNRFKSKKRVAIKNILLKEYIISSIGTSQGSNFNNCLEEFGKLIDFLFDKFADGKIGKIVASQSLITEIQSKLNDTQIEIHLLWKKMVGKELSLEQVPSSPQVSSLTI